MFSIGMDVRVAPTPGIRIAYRCGLTASDLYLGDDCTRFPVGFAEQG